MSYIAEQNIIGSLLLDESSIEKIYSKLSADMFTSELYGRIYLEFQRGYDNHYPVDATVIEQKLRSDSFPSHLVVDEIKTCVSGTFTTAYVEQYADVIYRDFKAQKLNLMLNTIKVTPSNFEEQIGAIFEELEAFQDDRKATSKTLSQITLENKENYFKPKDVKPINTGFTKLDNMLGDLEGGDMIIIGARPAVGKSALVTQITTNLAKNEKRIGFYNLEMQSKQVYERFIVNESGIGLTRLRRAISFLGDEKERFDRANEILETRKNIVITTGSKSIGEIRNECRHMNYDILIIDYLQLIKTEKSYKGNRVAEVGAISKAIKALAMELNIPVIVLSQLNRASEGRETKEPTMAELREAGDLEQDASIIILLWNLSNEDGTKKGCKVEKNRQGENGKEVLKFNGNLMQFEESDETIKQASEWMKSKDDECPFN